MSYNLESLTQIIPFDDKFSKSIYSDHGECAVCTPNNVVINSWNISNPQFHKYFNMGTNPPFKNTHLYGTNPADFQGKITAQVELITKRLILGEVAIQVIVEGYVGFFDQVKEKFAQQGFSNYAIVSILQHEPQNWNPTWNVTGILINTQIYNVLNSGVLQDKYLEEADNKTKDSITPYVYLEERVTGYKFILVGIHVSGTNNQYPVSGIRHLLKVLTDLKDQQEEYDVLAMGDFNTIPKNTKECIKNLANLKADLLMPRYPTHVNPLSQFGIYDFGLFLPKGDNKHYFNPVLLKFMSNSTKELAEEIEINFYKNKT